MDELKGLSELGKLGTKRLVHGDAHGGMILIMHRFSLGLSISNVGSVIASCTTCPLMCDIRRRFNGRNTL